MSTEFERPPMSANTKLVILGLAGLYIFYRLFYAGPFTFSHNIHLPIHEAGHLFFTPLGEFMHFLGGSLFQVVFPLVFVGSFLLRKDLFSASIIAIWAADSLMDVSYYIGDAYAQRMPLIGGEHDWAFLLGRLDWVHHAEFLGGLTWWIGCLGMLLTWFAALFALGLEKRWVEF